MCVQYEKYVLWILLEAVSVPKIFAASISYS